MGNCISAGEDFFSKGVVTAVFRKEGSEEQNMLRSGMRG